MIRCAFCLFLVLIFSNQALAIRDNWNEAKSSHFIVYYKNVSEDFINRLINKSEENYNKIADSLGFMRFNFWLWENRAKIFIYDNASDYHLATGQPVWSEGASSPSKKIIHTFAGEENFFETVLPHEMGHIIFREFVGFDNPAVPIWLDEGVASYQESFKRELADSIVKKAIQQNRFIDLVSLSNINPYSIQDSESVNLFYAESTSIINYLIKEFGKDKFVLFCQNLRDKKNLERAIVSSYPFSNIRELNNAWQGYLRND
jgi:hypothetical protein